MKTKKLSHQRGQISFLLIFSLASILLIASLAVDGGRLYFAWTGLSRALDAACSSVIRKASTLSDAQIQTAVDQVARYNLQNQGINVQNVGINTTVLHNAAFNGLVKLNIAGTISNFASALLTRAPGQPHANITAQTICPTCYNNPTSFTLPEASYYEGGLACQRACNDGNLRIPGTQTSCPFYHGINPCLGATNCTCASTVAMANNTNSCNIDANPSSPVNPADPGISGPVWIDRNQENNLQNACNTKCGESGSLSGAITCNEGSREDNGTVCCMCHCA